MLSADSTSIDISASTSECKEIFTLNFPRDLISCTGCINDGLISSLSTSNINFEISTQKLIHPQQGAPVYLEIDYKSSTEFLVGMYINYSQDVVRRDLLWVTPKQEWNKIYINLTQTVSESIGAESFKVFLNMRRNEPSLSEEINFDNLKILY